MAPFPPPFPWEPAVFTDATSAHRALESPAAGPPATFTWLSPTTTDVDRATSNYGGAAPTVSRSSKTLSWVPIGMMSRDTGESKNS